MFKNLFRNIGKREERKESIDDTIDYDLYLELKTKLDKIEPTLKGF